MKKVLIILLVFLLIAAGCVGGFMWYQNTHIFVDDAVYAKSADSLDLRGTGISVAHYDAVHAQLPDCEILWDVPFQGGSYSSDTTSLTITELTDQDMDMLEYFPGLKTVDASGCADYARLEALKSRFPGVEVAYQVSIGSKSFGPDVTELTLETADFDYGTLLENLQYLPAVEKITLTKTELTLEEIGELATYREGLIVDYTVELLGKEYAANTTEMDLSAMTSDDVEEAAAGLAMLENVASIELMSAEGTSALTFGDVKALKQAAPGAAFHYSFEYFGTTISLSDEEVKIKNKKIGEDGVEDVRLILDILDNCSRFVLDNCRISDETLAELREDYRDKTKIVWRVWFGKTGSTLTDAEVIRGVYHLTDKNTADLVYCEDVLYVDFGHDVYLEDFSFIAGMKSLEAAIISGSPIEDVTPFASCENLKFLEMANCTYVEDLTPLANCKQLEMLNISLTHVTDLSPLDGLNLTHLTAVNNRIPTEEEERFAAKFPDCWVNFKTSSNPQPYGAGWRYDEDGNQLEWYSRLAEAFKYPDAPNWTGWYLS